MIVPEIIEKNITYNPEEIINILLYFIFANRSYVMDLKSIEVKLLDSFKFFCVINIFSICIAIISIPINMLIMYNEATYCTKLVRF